MITNMNSILLVTSKSTTTSDMDGIGENPFTASNYEGGKSYFTILGNSDAIIFDISDSGINVHFLASRPTEFEIKQFDSNASFEIRFLELRGIIFGLFKIGALSWSDAPYSIHLSKNFSDINVLNNDNGFPLDILLHDTRTGKLVAKRELQLSPKMCKKLFRMIEAQKCKPLDIRDYDSSLLNVYRKYSTNELVKLTSDYFKIR